jgi:hypothetical protein
MPLPPAYRSPPQASAAGPPGLGCAASLTEARKQELFRQFSAAEPSPPPADDTAIGSASASRDAAAPCPAAN